MERVHKVLVTTINDLQQNFSMTRIYLLIIWKMNEMEISV